MMVRTGLLARLQRNALFVERVYALLLLALAVFVASCAVDGGMTPAAGASAGCVQP